MTEVFENYNIKNEFPPFMSKLLIYGIFCSLIKSNDNTSFKILINEIIKK